MKNHFASCAATVSWLSRVTQYSPLSERVNYHSDMRIQMCIYTKDNFMFYWFIHFEYPLQV